MKILKERIFWEKWRLLKYWEKKLSKTQILKKGEHFEGNENFETTKKKFQKSYNLKNKKILEKLVILNKIKKLENKNFEKNERFEKIAISKDMKNWDIWNIEYFRKQKILKK